MHARANAFVGRKQRKRAFRRLWITRINAAVRPFDLTYSNFMNGLNKAGVNLNRKALSELAIQDPSAFEELVQLAKSQL